ncbi:MAG: DUF1631 domain-containing protein [gamma proteobacterium symbiont of Lucinoma myriamae]|nr:DUF1631 domain-containing protein [gamma proteobacterium symbiont of Lucinoma myriamae]MCU7833254.1 DUF1631 domain-containing protein [gamma proteobacterium symbiont of Lucinoma myriamae]
MNFDSNENELLALEKFYFKKNQDISNLINLNLINQYESSTTELINAIYSMQSKIDLSKEAIRHSGISIRNQISEKIVSQANKSPKNTELINNKLHIIDIIEDIFAHISVNKELSSTALYLIRSLILPILQLAIADDFFIHNKYHPARDFLYTFSNASLGLINNQSKENNPLYLKLKRIAIDLNQANPLSTADFRQADNELKEFISYQKKNANTQSHSSERFLEAKIHSEIESCIKNKQVPDGIMTILNKVWKNVMLDIYSDDSCNEDDREKATTFINSLLFSIKPSKTDIEKRRLEKIMPVINQELEDGM